ncbi:MAG: hypothetical protein AAF329_00455 [Cyanobacteria bacterium P01_A01_bin.17]
MGTRKQYQLLLTEAAISWLDKVADDLQVRRSDAARMAIESKYFCDDEFKVPSERTEGEKERVQVSVAQPIRDKFESVQDMAEFIEYLAKAKLQQS